MKGSPMRDAIRKIALLEDENAKLKSDLQEVAIDNIIKKWNINVEPYISKIMQDKMNLYNELNKKSEKEIMQDKINLINELNIISKKENTENKNFKIPEITKHNLLKFYGIQL